MLLWVGCIAGALDRNGLPQPNSQRPVSPTSTFEPTRIYDIEDARTFPHQRRHRRRCDRTASRWQILQRLHPRQQAAAANPAAAPTLLIAGTRKDTCRCPLQRSLSLHRQLRALHHGGGHSEPQRTSTFTAYSAGSHPAGSVRPEALRQLEVGPSSDRPGCAAKAGTSLPHPVRRR